LHTKRLLEGRILAKRSVPDFQHNEDVKMKELSDYEYYRTELGVLYCGDYLDILPLLSNVDLCLTDPPYAMDIKNKIYNDGKDKKIWGNSKAKKRIYNNLDWDKKPVRKEIFNLMFNLSKKQIIFGGNFYSHVLSISRGWIVWDKETGDNDFGDCELAWTNYDRPIKKYKWRWNGMLQENMQEKEERVHPSQKPTGLLQLIINDYCKDGGVILDPFLGSGTTALACEKLGRKWIGIEISEEYCKIAKKRIKAEADQLKMF